MGRIKNDIYHAFRITLSYLKNIPQILNKIGRKTK